MTATALELQQQINQARNELAAVTKALADLEAAIGARPEIPLTIQWDRSVTHADGPGGDTIVHCRTDDGHPVALFLDQEYREALGLLLVDPDPDHTP